ncbi:MAG: lytic transglycosylase domain-containing protein [Thermoleophilia bacterium]
MRGGSERAYTLHAATGRRVGLTLRHRMPALLVLALLFGAVFGVAVWQTSALPPFLLGRLYPLSFQEEIAAAARTYEVDPYLVAAVARAESGFEPEVVSRAGAVGVMQLMPETAEWLAEREDWRGPAAFNLEKPHDNIALGAFYLSVLLESFAGDREMALAAYNAGPNQVRRWIEEEAARAQAEGVPSAGMGDIPFPETRSFVERVEKYESLYRRGHPDAFSG